MNIPQLCAQLLRQGEHVRLRCKQVQSDLAQIFALQASNGELVKELQQLYYDRLAHAATDIAACEVAVEEAKETVKQLISKSATRPIPFVRL